MWAMPDELNRMLVEKRNHPEAGASTAWVPSPTAATLHAMHYHHINVSELQQTLMDRKVAYREQILQIPLADDVSKLTRPIIERELSNNIQGILGYVVPWINDGVGCSKIPDINNVGLMEDRATLRISCQHVANWLAHGICSKEDVERTLLEMAAVVDEQNWNKTGYVPLLPDPQDRIAFQAARELIYQGCTEENGYTEDILHRYRLRAKALTPRTADTTQTYQLSMAN